CTRAGGYRPGGDRAGDERPGTVVAGRGGPGGRPGMTSPTRPGDALSETQRRFLSAVLERLPRELVHEVYLFAPMKQGGVETGIAVVAIGEAAAPGADPAGAGDAGAAESGVAGA